MLILSQAKISVNTHGGVKLEGVFKQHASRVIEFIVSLGLRKATIRYRHGRFLFSRNVDPATQQRVRNFLLNLPALKKSQH